MKDSAVKKFLKSEFYALKLNILIFFIMSIITSILEIVGIGLIFPFIYVLVSPKAIEQFKALAYLAKTFHLTNSNQLNIVLLCIIAILIFIKAGYTIFFRYWQMKMITDYKSRLSKRLVSMYLFSDYSLHMEKTTSEIIKNVALAPLIYDHYIMSYFNLIISVIMCVGLSGLLLLVLPWDALFAFLTIAAAVYVLNRLMKKHFSALGKENNELYEQRQKMLTQALGAFRDTKVLGRERHFVGLFSNVERANFYNQQYYTFLSSLPPIIMEAWIMVSIMGVILVYIYFNAYAQALATFGVLLAVMFRMLPQVNRILVSLQLIDSSEYILNSISTEFDLHEKDVFIPSKELEHARLPLNSGVEFKNVAYSYPHKSEFALKNLNLIIPKCSFIGLTGPSGSGKSTFLNLFLGLVPASQGQVLVDNDSLTDKPLQRQWQNNIGYVPQNLFIIEDSILANVAFGIEKDDIDIERAHWALKQAMLEDLIQTLPNGIHELVGEGGSKLSGGQKQRIGIARALYRDLDILIFDEVSNGLDANLEAQFIKTLLALKGKKTILMISHKLNTLTLCDQILVFCNSEVIDQGSFKELEQRCDLFKGLLKSTKMNSEELINPEVKTAEQTEIVEA